MTDEAAQLAREIVEFANRWTPFDGSAINDVCAGALPELLRTALAAKDAEIERLLKEFEKSSQRHLEADRSTEEYCEHLRQKNDALRERLEAAERFLFNSLDGGSTIEMTRVPSGWSVYISHYGQYGPKGGRLGYFKDFDAAHASLVKAGWLPPVSTNNHQEPSDA